MTSPLDRLAFWLLLLFAFIIPWENIVMIGGVGTVGKLVGFVAIAAGLVSVVTRRGFAVRPPSAFLTVLVVYVAWSAATYYWSSEPDETLRRLSTLLQLLALQWLIWQLGVTAVRRERLLQAYVFGGFISVLSTVVSFNSLTAEDYQRYAALGFDANDLGATLALGIPFAWHLARATRNRLLYLVNLAYIPAALVAIVLSSSRSALLVAAVGLCIIPLTLPQLSRARRIGLGVVSVVGVCSLFYFGRTVLAPVMPNLERLATISEELAAGDLNGRTVIWGAGLQAFADRPVGGAGLNTFPYAVEPYLGKVKVSHNSFLSVLVDTGLVGFALFGTALLLVLLPLLKLEPLPRHFTVLVFITLMVAMFPLSWEYRKPAWFILGLLTTYRAFTFIPRQVPAPLRRMELHD